MSKMKESIESARYEFDNLKKALKDISYGEDTYKFILTPNSQKRNLYNMIMADDNLGTSNLFSGNFESQYKDEIDELFTKIKAGDSSDQAKAVFENKDEIFIRELSVKLFNDSKKLETIESQIRSFLYRYGEYDDKDTVLEEHNILKTPTYVMVKGKGILNFGQTIDLSKIDGDIGLSTKTLNQLCSVDLQGAEVVTIENLTNFHKFQPNNQLVIYLGGFHNSIKRDFIKRVDYCNPGTKFFHFGDIDAGGFYILEHLIKNTGIAFIPLNMNIETLKNHKTYWKPLSENDKSRLDIR